MGGLCPVGIGLSSWQTKQLDSVRKEQRRARTEFQREMNTKMAELTVAMRKREALLDGLRDPSKPVHERVLRDALRKMICEQRRLQQDINDLHFAMRNIDSNAQQIDKSKRHIVITQSQKATQRLLSGSMKINQSDVRQTAREGGKLARDLHQMDVSRHASLQVAEEMGEAFDMESDLDAEIEEMIASARVDRALRDASLPPGLPLYADAHGAVELTSGENKRSTGDGDGGGGTSLCITVDNGDTRAPAVLTKPTNRRRRHTGGKAETQANAQTDDDDEPAKPLTHVVAVHDLLQLCGD